MIARLSKTAMTATAIALLAVALNSGCSSYPAATRTDPTQAIPTMSVHAITAPIDRSGYRELARLQSQLHVPAARLRSAYILIENRRVDEALNLLNGMLFGDVDHGPSVESYARFLRSRAFEQLGESERASHERDQALAKAVDPALRVALGETVAADDIGELTASGPLEILPRSLWKARQAEGPMDKMGRITRITVHHSGILSRDRSARAAVASIRAIQRHHQDVNGWSDIGYHYLIDASGRVWEGREIAQQGAHAGGPSRNRGNVGICLLGNFIDGGQRPNPAQVAALEGMISSIMTKHRLGLGDLLTHRELKVTTCPGPLLQAEVDRMRRGTPAQLGRAPAPR